MPQANIIKPSLLLIDDDKDFCTFINMALESNYEMTIAHRAESALSMLHEREFDLIILDWELPDTAGVDIARIFRDQSKLTPILMLTGRREIDDRVFGLDSGADDYLTKPFEIRELEARLRRLLRDIGNQYKNDMLHIGDLALIRSRHCVTYAGQPIDLAAHEFAVLELLMKYPGRWHSINYLNEKLWNSEASEDAIRACLKRLKKKLGSEASELIDTKYGIGYSIRRSER